MGKVKKITTASKSSIYGGQNEFHMRFVQEARRSNMSGFNEPGKKARRRQERKQNKLLAKDAQRGIF